MEQNFDNEMYCLSIHLPELISCNWYLYNGIAAVMWCLILSLWLMCVPSVMMFLCPHPGYNLV